MELLALGLNQEAACEDSGELEMTVQGAKYECYRQRRPIASCRIHSIRERGGLASKSSRSSTTRSAGAGCYLHAWSCDRNVLWFWEIDDTYPMPAVAAQISVASGSQIWS